MRSFDVFFDVWLGDGMTHKMFTATHPPSPPPPKKSKKKQWIENKKVELLINFFQCMPTKSSWYWGDAHQRTKCIVSVTTGFFFATWCTLTKKMPELCITWLLCWESIGNTVNTPQGWLSGVPDYFDRNKILSGYDLSHYQVPHCIRVFFYFALFVLIHHNFFNFILNYVPIVTFWIFTYHKIWILLIIFCLIWSYWIIYFLTCLEVFWSVVS